MAKFTPTKVVATFEEAMRGIVVAKYKMLVIQLLKMDWRWKETNPENNDTFTMNCAGDEYYLHTNLISMEVVGRDALTAEHFEIEIKETSEWKELKEASEIWNNFSSQYWDF